MSSETTAQLHDQRAKLVHDARAIISRAEAENRPMRAEERQQWDTMLAEASRLKDRIKQSKAEGRLSRPEPRQSAGRRLKLERRDQPRQGSGRPRWLNCGRAGRIRLEPGTAAYQRSSRPHRQAFTDWLRGMAPSASLQTDIASSGGFLAPEAFVAEVIAEADDLCFYRTLARIHVTDKPSLGTPSRTGRASSAAWGAELQAPVNDVGLKFGKRLWTPHYLTGQILVSRDLMRSATINVDEYVRKEIALDTDYREEEAYMVGHGVGRPLGIFVASTDGIPTTRDYAGANTGTALVASTFIQAKYQLKPRYRRSPSCSWLFHRTVLGAVAALQDGDGRFLFELSREAGEPDRLCGIPVNETEFAPATMTTGLYVGVLGDHSQYWIAESLELDIQRLVETHAGTNQDAYLYRRKIDGMPTQGEAFVRIKMG